MSTVRTLLPDYFAAEPRPKSWHGICCTLAGILIVLYMISQSLGSFLREKKATSSELVPSLGVPYELVLLCNSELPCLFEHHYQDPACSQAVQGRLADAQGALSATVRPGERHTVILCGSDTWGDGVRVAAPARAGGREPIVSYLLNGATRFSRLPFSPLRKPETCRAASPAVSDSWCDRHCSGVPAVCPSPLLPVEQCRSIAPTTTDGWCMSNCNRDNPNCPPDECLCSRSVEPTLCVCEPAMSTSVEMARVGKEDETTGSYTTMFRAAGGVESQTPCADGFALLPPAPASPPTAPESKGSGKGGGDDDGDSGEVVVAALGAARVLCYQLRLEPLVTELVTTKATGLFELLDEWGGAYGLVFGVFAACIVLISRVARLVSERWCPAPGGSSTGADSLEQRRLSHPDPPDPYDGVAVEITRHTASAGPAKASAAAQARDRYHSASV